MIQIYRRSSIKMVLLITVIAASMMACDLGSSDDDPPIVIQTSAVEKLNGIWEGEYGSDNTFIGFLLMDGDIYVSDDNEGIFAGTYTYTQPDNVFTANFIGTTGTIDVSGTATEQGSIVTTYANTNGNTGEASLQFSDHNSRTSSFELLSGQWASERSNFVIDQQGGLTGTFLDACQITGTLSISNPDLNLYVLDVDLAGCDNAGQYHGLVCLVPNDNVEDGRFFGIAANEEKFIRLVVNRP